MDVLAGHRFIMRSGIQAPMVGMLTALPRTPLYLRLEREGRLMPESDRTNDTGACTNIIPRRKGYAEMVAAYKTLYARLLTDRGIVDRILNKMRRSSTPRAERCSSGGAMHAPDSTSSFSGG